MIRFTALTITFEDVAYANIQGTLVTQKQSYDWHLPEIAKSFVWQDGGIWYAIDFYSENHTLKEGHPQHWRNNISQEELAKILSSFAPRSKSNMSAMKGLGIPSRSMTRRI